MEFNEFKPEELLGKSVCVRYKNNRSISVIEKITKTGFRVKGESGLFNFNGWLKGDTWRNVFCVLITDDEVIQLRKEFAEKKEGKAIIELFDINKTTLSIDKLREIEKIIKS